jgi:hypothetical protein
LTLKTVNVLLVREVKELPLEKSTLLENVCLLSKKNAKPKDCVEIGVDAED